MATYLRTRSAQLRTMANIYANDGHPEASLGARSLANAIRLVEALVAMDATRTEEIAAQGGKEAEGVNVVAFRPKAEQDAE